MWREEGDTSLSDGPLRGAFVRAKRRASPSTMLFKAFSAAVYGIDAYIVDVEVAYRCTVCGMRLTVTQAQDEPLVAPRHCREDMEVE